jgi:hypothetical protein
MEPKGSSPSSQKPTTGTYPEQHESTAPHPFQVLFAKLRKATIRFVMCTCLSVRMEQLGSHWTDFHKI